MSHCTQSVIASSVLPVEFANQIDSDFWQGIAEDAGDYGPDMEDRYGDPDKAFDLIEETWLRDIDPQGGSLAERVEGAYADAQVAAFEARMAAEFGPR